jgi:PAS domain S-box-containing protein
MQYVPMQTAAVGAGIAYPVSRLFYTLLFMTLLTAAAVAAVMSRTRNKLLGEIAARFGVFMLVIGTTASTVAFRGLRLSEMLLSWAVSALAIAVFLRRMQVIMTAESAQKRDAAVNASEARFQSIIENSAEGMSIVTCQGALRYASPAVERLLGFEASELEGSKAIDFVDPDDVERYWEMFLDVGSESGRTRSDEFRYVHKDKTSRMLAVTAKNLCDIPGVEGVIVNMRDVTEQRTLEQQLQQAQKMETIGQLAGGIAHDFNNLLTAISGRTEFLSESSNLGVDQREDVDEIRRAAERAARLTKQLLTFSRKQLFVPRVLDLNQIVVDTGPMLRRLIGEDVQIHTIRQDGLGNIIADSGQIEQVLLNLSLNARDAMPSGGMLTIETANADLQPADGGVAQRPAGEFVMLRIADTGQGMDAHTRAHLFEPFFTTKPVGQGTGLGLSTVYGIVKQSDATIEVDSSVGHGTTFRIYFPRTCAAAMPDSDREHAEQCAGGTERILLVEDDNSVGQLARRILAGKGYRVTLARGGAAAIRIFEESPDGMDLVLTDLVMPGMSGRDLMQRLHRARPRLRVLYMSGYTNDDILRRGLHDPSVWFLQKPFTGAGLLTKVRQVLDGAERDPVRVPTLGESGTV